VYQTILISLSTQVIEHYSPIEKVKLIFATGSLSNMKQLAGNKSVSITCATPMGMRKIRRSLNTY
jgi:hypothetical protein